ncbi:hypothetical protein BG004_007572 [Podila humilis]|nr:hypothetical protein BG004_007572 [Podila humilis]
MSTMRTMPVRVLLLTGALLALSTTPTLIAASTTTAAAAQQQQHAFTAREPIAVAQAPEAFHEELVLKPLNDGSVYSHFQFTTHIGTMMDDDRFDGTASNLFTHYNLFPRSIGQILHNFEVEELHLTFTQGRWQYGDWGYPLAPSAGTGVELWAWLNDNKGQTDANWKALTNTLSGLFCASLNFIDETITVEPKMSFRNEGLYNTHYANSDIKDTNNTSSPPPRRLRYGSLPHENVCTENLTPWIKLLPCKSKAGIASLLKSHKLFDSRFYSMAIHVRPVCEDDLCRVRSLELVQTITTVFDVARHDGSHDWSISGLFEREINQACPLASTSKVVVQLPQLLEPNQYDLTPPPPQGTYFEGTDQDKVELAVYDLFALLSKDASDSTAFQLAMTWRHSKPRNLKSMTPGIVAHRYFTGYGQERGGLSVEIHNNNWEQLDIIYMDTLPWYLKLYLHTFAIELNDIIKKMFYQPAVDRSRPAVLEIAVMLPPKSMVKFSLSFDKVFLKYTEHHPDANRGFDVGCAVITAELPRQRGQIGYGGLDHLRIYQDREATLVRSKRVVDDHDNGGGGGGNGISTQDLETDKIRVYTETLLVSLPTPDFSMPYNVITLTCTVIALFFGSMFNLMTRSFEIVMPPVHKNAKDKEVEK